MKKIFPKIIISAATFVAPLSIASVASADPIVPITICSFSQPNALVPENGSAVVTLTTNGTAAWMEATFDPDKYSQTTKRLHEYANGTNHLEFHWSDFALNGEAAAMTLALYPTDGTVKTSNTPLCTYFVSFSAAATTTTTVEVVPTLPHTGSNTGTLLAGGAMVLAFGGALYVSGRRRSIK
jgi:LPXTG-motif cell wall-anchored protein